MDVVSFSEFIYSRGSEEIPFNIFFTHKPFEESSLSSGEYMMLSIFGRISSLLDKILAKDIDLKNSPSFLLLLDEAELGFHPQWQKTLLVIFLILLTTDLRTIKSKYY
jgi:predicted ATP-dependent endonuclease of OLD family